MKFIATKNAINKLNMYNMTEMELTKEFRSYKEVEEGKKDIGQVVMNWKNEDLIVAPIGKRTALVVVMDEELNQSYEDLPEIEYVNKLWKEKK